MTDTCENCKFADKEDNRNLRSRRYPPTVISQYLAANSTAFPEVWHHHWCGEWKPILEDPHDAPPSGHTIPMPEDE